MSEQSPEIFDDLYLGLQAGGAMRKQRRGEELTEQEAAALGRWQRLSMWRKGVAIGAFAFGTFGLGFTLGGLIFGRRAGAQCVRWTSRSLVSTREGSRGTLRFPASGSREARASMRGEWSPMTPLFPPRHSSPANTNTCSIETSAVM